jgi:hypothetical protein
LIARNRDELHPTARRLPLARDLRSVGQGVLAVDFALYLQALGWRGSAIGLVLTGADLFGAGLSTAIGFASDQLRRKPFLLIHESPALVCSVAVLSSVRSWVITVSAVVGGFGRGANGAAGPLLPAEQAWLAQDIAPVTATGCWTACPIPKRSPTYNAVPPARRALRRLIVTR